MSLAAELTNDPEALGYQAEIDAGDHQAVAALLNAPRYSTVGAQVINSAQLLIWAGQNSRLDSVRTAATQASSADIRSVASAALQTIQRSDTVLDLSRAEIVGMLDALVSAGVFTAADKTSLETASARAISRAEQLGLGTVTHTQIAEALA